MRCTGPAQSYLCEVTGASVSADSRTAGFYCAARLAEEHGHRTCAVARQDTQCEGEPRRIVYEPDAPADPAMALGESAEDAGEAETPPGSDQETAQNKEGPPGTMVELTRETARKTGESLRRAADETADTTRSVGEQARDAAASAAGAVDRAARRTWKCVGSLFDDC